MGTCATVRSAFVVSLTLTGLLGMPAWRSCAQASNAQFEASPSIQAHRGRTKALPSRHAPRGFRNQSATAGRRDGSAGSDGLTDAFFRGAIEISGRLGCSPRDLLAVMMRESLIEARARNATSGAVGLIQFLPGTLRSLGWTGTSEEFRALGATEQLPWVEKFLRPSSRYGLTTPARVYQAIFMPASLRLGAVETTALIAKRGIYADRYSRNRPLDIDGDGRITVGELQQAIDVCCTSAAWQEVERRLGEMTAVGRTAPAGSTRRRSTLSASIIVADESPDRDRTQKPARPSTTVRSESLRAEDREPDERSGSLDLSTNFGLTSALRALGYDADPEALAPSLRAFQRGHGIPADGRPGRMTRAAIAEKLDAIGVTASL